MCHLKYLYSHNVLNQKNPASFLSMDTENRVLRFDSLSKVLSAGLRIGFVTGPKQLIDRIELHVQSTVMHTPALTQVPKRCKTTNKIFN